MAYPCSLAIAYRGGRTCMVTPTGVRRRRRKRRVLTHKLLLLLLGMLQMHLQVSQ